MAQRQPLNWRSRKHEGSLRVFFFLFCFVFLPSYIPHVSMHFEKSRRAFCGRFELFDDQRRKSASIIWFLSSPWSEFRQLSTACKRTKSDDLSSNYRGMLYFRNLRNCSPSFTTDLYYHECCLIKLALEKLNWKEQLPDCEANSKVICSLRNLWHRAPVQRPTYHKKNLRQKNYDWLKGQFPAVNVEV